MCGPTAGLIMTGVAGITQMYGAIQEGKAQSAMYKQQEKEALMNRDLALRNVDGALYNSQIEKDRYLDEFDSHMSTQQTTSAFMGRDSSSGSALDLMLQDVSRKDKDMSLIGYKTMQDVHGFQQEAVNYSQSAENNRAAGVSAKSKAKMEALKIGLQTGLQIGSGAGWFKGSTKVLKPVTPLVGPRLPNGNFFTNGRG